MGKIRVYDRENPQVNFERKEGSRTDEGSLYSGGRRQPNSTSGHSSTIDCGGIDMIDIVLIKPKDKDNEFPMIDVSPEPEPPDDSFEVTYDGPILDLFSYSVRRPVNAIFMDSVVEDMSVKADVLQKLKDNKDTIAEVDHPNSHLHESLELLRIWGAKKAVVHKGRNIAACICRRYVTNAIRRRGQTV
ncbi:hypothetical protein BLNAU_25052 [Blattamonas nauphoetae]|uniref:Uncharacterized protein n=1 Tax=Blattamonas nauphoetae TaxID=2049346 RepID=A0ABQ9WNI8_9EUKA|nr:hypothetical protein BLNAU_25052 [Blattamonas nauphoetae]